MSQQFGVRLLLLEIQDVLSDNDRRNFYSILGNNVPKYLCNDPSPKGALRVLEFLFEKSIISDEDCYYLIEAFEKIHCNEVAKRLQDYQRSVQQSSQKSFSAQNILLFDNEEEDMMYSI
ncbi:unnamed protein product, partial [Rotaria sp. Silwood1]